MLALPLPFGPTTPVTWEANSIPVRSAKVLNPLSSRRFRRTPAPPPNHPPALGPSLRLGRANARASGGAGASTRDRKSTRLNSSHSQISYAVFCLKKKKQNYRNEF